MQHCRMLFYLLYIRFVTTLTRILESRYTLPTVSCCHDKGTMSLEFTRNVEKRRRKSRSTVEEEYMEKETKKKRTSLFVRKNETRQLKRTRFGVLENNGGGA